MSTMELYLAMGAEFFLEEVALKKTCQGAMPTEIAKFPTNVVQYVHFADLRSVEGMVFQIK